MGWRDRGHLQRTTLGSSRESATGEIPADKYCEPPPATQRDGSGGGVNGGGRKAEAAAEAEEELLLSCVSADVAAPAAATR